MRLLLIGAAGLVGRHLRVALVDHDVLPTTRRGEQDTVALDLTDHARVAELVRSYRPEAMIVAAADAYVERCELEPARTRAVNVDAPAVLAELAAEFGSVLVVFSSEYVFGSSAGVYSEDAPVSPLNEYGRQKADLEAAVRSTPRHLICRTSAVYGWEPKRKNFVCQVVDTLRHEQPFRVPSDQVVTPTDARSLASAVIELLTCAANGTFHVVGPEILSRISFAHLIADVFDLPVALVQATPSSELGLRARRPTAVGLSDQKLRSTLGHGLPMPRDALKEMKISEAPETTTST